MWVIISPSPTCYGFLYMSNMKAKIKVNSHSCIMINLAMSVSTVQYAAKFPFCAPEEYYILFIDPCRICYRSSSQSQESLGFNKSNMTLLCTSSCCTTSPTCFGLVSVLFKGVINTRCCLRFAQIWLHDIWLSSTNKLHSSTTKFRISHVFSRHPIPAPAIEGLRSWCFSLCVSGSFYIKVSFWNCFKTLIHWVLSDIHY